MPFQQVEKSRSFIKKLFVNLQNRAKLQLGPIFIYFYVSQLNYFYVLHLLWFNHSCAWLLLCFIVLACFASPMCFIAFSNLFHLKLNTKYLLLLIILLYPCAHLFPCFIVPCVSPCLDQYYHLFFQVFKLGTRGFGCQNFKATNLQEARNNNLHVGGGSKFIFPPPFFFPFFSKHFYGFFFFQIHFFGYLPFFLFF